MSIESKNQRIIIADEDKDVRFLIQMYLRNYNVKIIECRNGQECLDSINRFPPDLVVMNYMLDKYTGYQIAREIAYNERFKNIPVIMMTLEGFDLREENTGVDDYLAKPFTRNLFLETVQRVMGDNMFIAVEKGQDQPPRPVILEKKEEIQIINEEIKKKILVADDEPDIIKLIKMILQTEYELDVVYSGEELVEKVKEKQYDLIISDVIMPKLSGWKSIKQIRDNGCKVPVIFNSGLVKDKELYETLKPEGPSYFILKPFKKDTLLSLVKQVIEESVI